MAYKIPSEEDIRTLPHPLTKGEKVLIDALMCVLDDDWTVYVQPHVNGLRPDVIVFSPKYGMSIFEVKDWSLGTYKIEKNEEGDDYQWLVVKDDKEWEVNCPYKQVERYKQAIIKHEIPEISAQVESELSFYSVLSTFVYFHGFSRQYLKNVLEIGKIENKYRYCLGDDSLKPDEFRNILDKKMNLSRPIFSDWLTSHKTKIHNTLYPPKYGKTDLKYLNYELTPKQKNLMPNNPGKRRVLGSAGAGKTFVLVRKAVQAAREEKYVLLVMFNITIVNYVRDLLARLSSYYGSHVHRYITVRHYHALRHYPLSELDVLMIDEGQDFESEWVTRLLKMCKPNAHAMFVEDDRQNIYKRKKITVPSFLGRPNVLNATHRMSDSVTNLANALFEYYNIESESGVVQTVSKNQKEFGFFLPVWYNATSYEDALNALKQDIKTSWDSGRFGQPSDTAILVSKIRDGWDIDEWFMKEARIPIPRNRMFESRSEANQVRNKMKLPLNISPKHEGWDNYQSKLNAVRRKYKLDFEMRNDGIKISTIHSFKGWELENIYILFSPSEAEKNADFQLLYTALTRSQNQVTIYNASPQLTEFGEYAITRGLSKKR